MTHDLQGAHSKVDWAERQLDVLKGEIDRYIASGPAEIWNEKAPERPGTVSKLRMTQAPPATLTGDIGMIIHQARSALDLLVVVLAQRNRATRTRHLYFPVYGSQTEYEEGSSTKLNGLSQKDVERIGALKPYKGGNDTIYLLHKLDLTDKHNRPLIAISSIAYVSLCGGIGSAEIGGDVDTWGPLDETRTLLWCGPESIYEFNVGIQIGISEPGIPPHSCVTETLSGFIALARSILNEFHV